MSIHVSEVSPVIAATNKAPIDDLIALVVAGKMTLAEVEPLVAARDANWTATTGKASVEAAHMKRAPRRFEAA